MNYYVKEFARGRYHVMKGKYPIYDDARYGNDKPIVFTDPDKADSCAIECNRIKDEELAKNDNRT